VGPSHEAGAPLAIRRRSGDARVCVWEQPSELAPLRRLQLALLPSDGDLAPLVPHVPAAPRRRRREWKQGKRTRLGPLSACLGRYPPHARGSRGRSLSAWAWRGGRLAASTWRVAGSRSSPRTSRAGPAARAVTACWPIGRRRTRPGQPSGKPLKLWVAVELARHFSSAASAVVDV
jgi:hypothetical protein